MKRSELKKIIQEVVKEQISPTTAPIIKGPYPPSFLGGLGNNYKYIFTCPEGFIFDPSFPPQNQPTFGFSAAGADGLFVISGECVKPKKPDIPTKTQNNKNI